MVRRVKQTDVVAQLESSGSFDTAVAGKQVEETEKVYYVHPEWKTPKGPAPDNFQRECGVETDWEWTGDETMHPFWAVRRLTHAQMSKEPADDRSVAGITVDLMTKEYTVVTLGVVQGQSVVMTLLVKVPYLTNV